MTQGTYFVGLDLNRDGYFARGSTQGDALNLVDNPAQLQLTRILSTGNPPRFYRDFYDTEQNYYWEFNTETDVDDGLYIGQTNSFEYATWIPSGSQITVSMEFKGITNYTGETLRFTAAGRGGGGGANTANTTVVLTGDWQRVSVTITPGSAHLLVTVERINTITDVTFQMRRHFVVLGSTVPTSYNTGAASDWYENITTYVTDMSWNNGMDHYDQTVSAGAKATITVDNRDNLFWQDDDLAEDIIENGDFATWTNANNPTDWTGTNTSANLQTTEVGSDELHGGSGTGALNLYATSRALVSCMQDGLTVFQRYKVEFSIGASSYTGGVRFFTGNAQFIYPISRLYTIPGVYTFYFTAGSFSQFFITNNRYPCDITLEFVRVTPVPRFAGLGKETLVSIRGYDSATEYQLWIGRINNIVPVGGYYGTRMVTLDCSDAMQEFNNTEYKPVAVYSDQSVIEELLLMFQQLQMLWPYAKDYWMLDTNVLGIDTWLIDGALLDWIYTTETFTVDFATASASNSEKGIGASAYTRDLMALEIGGRFFIDSRTGEFRVLAHDYDSSLTSFAAITDDGFDDYGMVSGEDVVNDVAIYYKQKRLGTGNIVLWSSQDDIVVEAQSTKTITGRYFDPTNELINVSATSTEPLVRGVDYVVSPTKDQHLVTVTVDAGGQSASFTIDNQRKVAVTLTTLQIRGFPLYALTEESVEVINVDSMLENNVQKRDYNMPLISDSDIAIAIATGLTSMRGENIVRLQSISFIATKDATRYTNGLNYGVGTPITITSSNLRHSQDYIIIGERHQITPGGEETHRITWTLKPMQLFKYWLLDEVGRSELGETTYLMP